MFLVIVLIAGGAAAAGFNYIEHCKSADGPHRPVTVTIPDGASGGDVVAILNRAGVLKCGGLFEKYLMRNNDKSGSVRAGTYHLTTNMTLDAALTVLSARPHHAATVRLTIPPGFRLTEIAARVHREFGIPAKEFLARANSGAYSLPPYLPKGTKTVEGFLYPETYQVVKKDATADSIIRMLLDQFRTVAKTLPWQDAGQLHVTPYQAVIVASMIEKEAGINSDRPLISAVIYHRLRIGMPLGIDAALLYDDPTPGDGTLSSSDLDSDSPYNTRKHAGLPPTPIASVSGASSDGSLQAALRPAHVDYLYYVLCPKDGKGHHRFSKTYADFLKNKQECLGG